MVCLATVAMVVLWPRHRHPDGVAAITPYEDKHLALPVARAVAATFTIKGCWNYVQSVAMSRAGNQRRRSPPGTTCWPSWDDDEVVAEDWLVHLVAGYCLAAPLASIPPQEGQLDAGMYPPPLCPEGGASGSPRGPKGTPDMTIVTNNLLAETSILRDHDIWFDEAKLDGDQDNALPTACIADAHAYEAVPSRGGPSRVSERPRHEE